MKKIITIGLFILGSTIFAQGLTCIATDLSSETLMINANQASLVGNNQKMVYSLKYQGVYGATHFFFNKEKTNSVIYYNEKSLEAKVTNFDQTLKMTNSRLFICAEMKKDTKNNGSPLLNIIKYKKVKL